MSTNKPFTQAFAPGREEQCFLQLLRSFIWAAGAATRMLGAGHLSRLCNFSYHLLVLRSFLIISIINRAWLEENPWREVCSFFWVTSWALGSWYIQGVNANKRSGHANPSRSWALDKEQCTFSWRRKERWEQKKEKELLRTPNALKKKKHF